MSATAESVAGQAAAAPAAAKKSKTEYEKVTMTDGREVEFPKGRKLDKRSFVTGEDGYLGVTSVRMDFANGETRLVAIPGADVILEMMAACELSDAEKARVTHVLRAAAHGYEQKLGDEMAYQPKKDEPEPTLEDKIEWVDELIGRLNALEWRVARESGSGGLAGASSLIQALVALSGKSKDEIRDFLKPLSREERAAIKRTQPVKGKIEEIEAEIAAKNGVDVTQKLAGLGLSG